MLSKVHLIKVDKAANSLFSVIPSKILFTLHNYHIEDNEISNFLESVLIDHLSEKELETSEYKSLKTRHEQRKIEVAMVSGGGMFLNKSNQLSVQLKNISDQTIKNIKFELSEESAEYEIRNSKAIPISSLKPNKIINVSFDITPKYQKQIAINYKINNILRQPPLYVEVVEDNPYICGPCIQNPTDFYGRKTEMDFILNEVIREKGSPVMIVGEQRSGKTSLLYQIRNRLNSPIVPIYIEIRDENNRSAKYHLNKILSEIKKTLTIKEILTKNDSDYGVKYASDFPQVLAKIIEDSKNFNPDFKLVVLLDEGDRIREINKTFQGNLRSAIVHLNKEFRIVITCSSNFMDYVSNTNILQTTSEPSPLENVFIIKYLPPLSEEDIEFLIRKPADYYNFSYDDNAVDMIKIWSGGHPFYCQKICFNAFNLARRNHHKIIREIHILKSVNEVLSENKIHFKRGYWDRLYPTEKSALEKIFRQNSISNIPSYIQQKLKSRYLIDINGAKIKFTAKLYEEWTRKLLEEMLSHEKN
ncbi:MAG: hypothetical protein GF353_29505 [Candidatus Lokiarchaeota archaeon]|nr:hypothetical protein [Candidatus Lokiarchaeota archaeon]